MNTSEVLCLAARMGPIVNENSGLCHDHDQHFLGWNIPPEHIDFVHPHWRNFHAPSSYWHWITALIYFKIFAVSIIGNGCVVWIFITSKALRTPSNFFIFNLSLLDLVMTQNTSMMIVNSLMERMLGWQIGCDIYAIFGSVSGIGSAMTHAAIAYDRYRTISLPIYDRLTSKQAILIIAFVWLWSMPFLIMPWMRIWGKFTPEGFLTSCSFDYLTDNTETRAFVATITIWAYVIPVGLVVLFYTRLIFSVSRHERMLKEQAKRMNVPSMLTKQIVDRKYELKIAKVALAICLLFLLSWTPYATLAFIGAFGNRDLISPVSSLIPAIFAKMVSCIDPWIYATSHPLYRKEFLARIDRMGLKIPDRQSQRMRDVYPDSITSEKSPGSSITTRL